MALTVLISYDIVADSRRAKVAASLQMWGDRIQDSVFICSLDADELQQLRERVEGLIQPEVDSVYFVGLCKSCWDGLVVLGQAHPPVPDLFWEVL